MFEDSVTYQFIGNVTKGADTEPADILDLPEGSVAIVDQNNDVVEDNDLAVGDRVRIAQKANGQMIYSPYFVMGSSTVNKYDYAADTQQVSYLGYNGTTGELDDTAGATYTLGVNLLYTSGVLNTTPQIKTIPAYNQSGTQYELATVLLKSFNKMMTLENRKPIRADRIYSGATTDIAETLAVVKGSTGVTAGGSPPNAGDWIFIEDNAGDEIVYKVEAVSGSNLTLDVPYTGDSETVSSNDWGTINDEDTGDWGIRFVGEAVDPNSFDVVTETHRVVSFKLSWDRVDAPAAADADPTTIDYDTDPVVGRGTFMEVGVREVYTTMNEGNPFISAYPPTKYRKMADPDNEYNVYVINATDDEYTSATTGQKPVSKYNIYIAAEEDDSDIEAHLDSLLDTNVT